jgi:hypothetical protein
LFTYFNFHISQPQADFFSYLNEFPALSATTAETTMEPDPSAVSEETHRYKNAEDEKLVVVVTV